jgi:hypothetical protein
VLLIGHAAYHVYGTVADYKGFKDSVTELCNEAREYGADVCDGFVAGAHVNSSRVYRKERRLKTPGRLLRLMNRLEWLEESFDDLSPKKVKEELRRARDNVDLIVDDLANKEEAKLVVKNLQFPKLGGPQDWPGSRDENDGRFAIRIRERELMRAEVEDLFSGGTTGPKARPFRYVNQIKVPKIKK